MKGALFLEHSDPCLTARRTVKKARGIIITRATPYPGQERFANPILRRVSSIIVGFFDFCLGRIPVFIRVATFKTACQRPIVRRLSDQVVKLRKRRFCYRFRLFCMLRYSFQFRNNPHGTTIFQSILFQFRHWHGFLLHNISIFRTAESVIHESDSESPVQSRMRASRSLYATLETKSAHLIDEPTVPLYVTTLFGILPFRIKLGAAVK